MEMLTITLAEIPIADGLRVMLTGLSGVFIALGLVALSITGLKRVVAMAESRGKKEQDNG